MPLNAIDVSYCQKAVDYKAVKLAGISAVIARNGYMDKTDDEFHTHITNALKNGLDVGTYTYLLSSNPAEARREARLAVKRLERYKGQITYPVFADMESDKYLSPARYDNTIRTAILCAFLETIEAEGYYPAVYINPAWLENYIDKKAILGKYDIWLAAWTENPVKETKFKYGQTMWQWGVGKVNGVRGKVDCDLVYCNYPQKIRSQGKNFLPKIKSVKLAFDAAVRNIPSAKGKKLGVLAAGTKCVIVEGTETKDPITGYTYIQLAGGKEQWIVKSAIGTAI